MPKRTKQGGKGGGAHKYGRNLNKCRAYRARVGKPRGPGRPGTKAGKHHTPVVKEDGWTK